MIYRSLCFSLLNPRADLSMRQNRLPPKNSTRVAKISSTTFRKIGKDSNGGILLSNGLDGGPGYGLLDSTVSISYVTK